MPTVIDSIVTEYELDPAKFIAGMKRVGISLDANQRDLDSHAKGLKRNGALFADLKETAAAAGSGIGTAAGIISGAILGIGAAAMKATSDFAGFERMTNSLSAVEGGARAAAESMAELKAIAAKPGLDLREAVTGYTGLRRNGLGKSEALATVDAAGNANAFSAGGKEELASIFRGLTQSLARDFLSAEEVNQLSEAGLAPQAMLKKEFGTSDTEQLKAMGITAQQAVAGLVRQMASLPKTAGGTANALDNLESSVYFMSVSAGSAIAKLATPSMEAFTSELDKFNEADIWASAIQSVTASMGGMVDSSNLAHNALRGVAVGIRVVGDWFGWLNARILSVGSFLKDMWAMVPAPLRALVEKGVGKVADKGREAFGNVWFDPVESWKKNAAIVDKQYADSAKKPVDQAAKAALKIEDHAAQSKPGATPQPSPLLERIAKNTDPLREIANNILGGGTLGKRGVSRQELADVRSGRSGGGRGGDPIERHIRDLVDAIRGSLVESQGMIPRRAV